MASEKTKVIEYLFFKNWDKKTKKLTKTVMTMADVQKAIRHSNKMFGTSLSDRNPANFMKDVVRGKGASRNWPQSVHDLRYTAVQTPGGGNVFEFRSYGPDQVEAFPDQY